MKVQKHLDICVTQLKAALNPIFVALDVYIGIEGKLQINKPCSNCMISEIRVKTTRRKKIIAEIKGIKKREKNQ